MIWSTGIAAIAVTYLFCRWRFGIQLRRATTQIHEHEKQLTILRTQMQMVQEERVRLAGENNHLHECNRELETQAAVLETRRLALEEKQQQLKLEIEKSNREFLDHNTEKLNRAAKENFETLLKPFDNELKDLKKKIHETYDTEARERISLQHALSHLLEAQKQMTLEATSLTKALKGDSKAQGDWGEVVLERILESSGLRPGLDFIRQGEDLSLKSEDGKHRKPDIVVKMPEGRNVIVDSKVSLKAYEAYTRCEDSVDRQDFQRAFVDSIRAHIKDLSGKDYQHLYGIQSPDCVLMFMPTDGAFSLALQADPNLSSMAWGLKVAIVSPSLLFPTLKIVEYLWRQDKQSKNSIEIAEQAGALYDKFCLLIEDIDRIGVKLSALEESYHDAVAKMRTGRGNILNRFEKIKLLGAKAKRQLSHVESEEPIAFLEEPPQEAVKDLE